MVLKEKINNLIVKAMDLTGALPYFPGKGAIIISILRLINLTPPFPIKLPNKSKILISSNDLHWTASIWLGKYQPEFTKVFCYLMEQLSLNSTVIDIGAHIGYYSLIAARYLIQKEGTVFAFEPHPVIFGNLRQNKEINNFNNLIPVQSAVSDKIGKVHLFAAPHTGYSSLSRTSRHNQIYEVESTTLDYFIASRNIQKIGLIKIDAEGAELLILKGSEHILMQDRPYIMYEENEEAYHDFGYSVEEVRRFLDELGYNIYAIDKISYYNNAIAVPR